jgi:hypothetical protein
MKTVKELMNRCEIEDISPVGKELSREHLRLVVGGDIKSQKPLCPPPSYLVYSATTTTSCVPDGRGGSRCSHGTKDDYTCTMPVLR